MEDDLIFYLKTRMMTSKKIKKLKKKYDDLKINKKWKTTSKKKGR